MKKEYVNISQLLSSSTGEVYDDKIYRAAVACNKKCQTLRIAIMKHEFITGKSLEMLPQSDLMQTFIDCLDEITRTNHLLISRQPHLPTIQLSLRVHHCFLQWMLPMKIFRATYKGRLNTFLDRLARSVMVIINEHRNLASKLGSYVVMIMDDLLMLKRTIAQLNAITDNQAKHIGLVVQSSLVKDMKERLMSFKQGIGPTSTANTKTEVNTQKVTHSTVASLIHNTTDEGLRALSRKGGIVDRTKLP